MIGDIKPKVKKKEILSEDNRLKQKIPLEKNTEEGHFIVPSIFEIEEMLNVTASYETVVSPEKKIEKKEKRKKIQSNELFFKTISVALLFLLGLFLYSLKINYPKIFNQSEELKNNIEILQENVAAKDTSNIAKNIELIAKQSNEIELSLQRMGQIITLYSFIPGAKSSISSKEISLTTANSLIIKVKNRTDKFIDENRNVFSKSNEETVFDFSLIKLSSSKYLVDINDFLALAQKKLSMASNTSESAILSNMISNIQKNVKDVNTFLAFNFDTIFGVSDQKKYLVLFQNNNELRGGSGGSLGSFGTVSFTYGKMDQLDFGKNIYKLDNEFANKQSITPPTELIPFKNWTMKQAGFAVDGKEALSKILWFYEKEANENVSGVFSIDTNAVVDLLKITGPIEIPKYNQTISADNFVDAIQVEVQKSYFEREGAAAENEPKKIIGDMFPIFLDKLSTQIQAHNEKSLLIFASLLKSLNNKDILIYFKGKELQSSIDNFNISGQVTPSIGDYLYVNDSNLGGNKTDTHMSQISDLEVKINKDGTVNSKLNLKRIHQGADVWPDGFDQNFVRVLVPEKSSITNFTPISGNFQYWGNGGYYPDGKYYSVSEEANKSTVNFWMSTKPGETSEASFTYAPNYKIEMGKEFSYKLLLQHQPGAPKEIINLNLTYPKGYTPTNVANYSKKLNSLNLKFELTSDKEVVLQFKKM